jgi:molybdenum cofactor biosynthesis protein A
LEHKQEYLTDNFGRVHNYLRISLTEHCNLRCFYCMPEEGLAIRNKETYLTASEIIKTAKALTAIGVNKIRLTGGEPLIRKEFTEIATELSRLPIELALTTNGILVHKHIEFFKEIGLTNINISLDSLDPNKNLLITKRDYFKQIRDNIALLIENGIVPKLNVVVMRNINDNEIIDFIELTKLSSIDVRFIEFMPFNGNKWTLDKCFSFDEIIHAVENHYGRNHFKTIDDGPNSTSKNFRVKDYKGSFGIISSITKPFCEGCNRIRLTADGKLKNCLFSSSEFDMLTPLREGKEILPVLKNCLKNKKEVRAGILPKDKNIELLELNRSMISIGG